MYRTKINYPQLSVFNEANPHAGRGEATSLQQINRKQIMESGHREERDELCLQFRHLLVCKSQSR